jgi:enterochelin esterase-like enzyme
VTSTWLTNATSLTGTPFLTAATVLAVGAFVGAVVILPRMSGWRLRAVAGRVAVLVVVNTLALLSLGTLANDSFGFFGNWADLTGAFASSPAPASAQVGPPAQIAAQAVVPPSPVAAVRRIPLTLASLRRSHIPVIPLAGGQEVRLFIRGKVSDVTTSVDIWLPPGYWTSNKKYPVIEAFTGYPGTDTQWIRAVGLPRYLRSQVAAGTMRDAIVVTPQVEVPAGTDTECVDGQPTGVAMETFVAQDLPQWIAQHLSVATGRESWATLGLSTGAWCAAMATMRHPSQYGGAIVMGGYFRPDFGRRYVPFGPSSLQAADYDLVALERTSPPPVAMWVQSSHADTLSFPSTAQLLGAVRAPTSVTSVVLENAGHRLSVWKGLLPSALQWLGSSLSGFNPKVPVSPVTR